MGGALQKRVPEKNIPAPFLPGLRGRGGKRRGGLLIPGTISASGDTAHRNSKAEKETAAHYINNYNTGVHPAETLIEKNRGDTSLYGLAPGQTPHTKQRTTTTMSRSGRWPYVRRMAWDRDRKHRAACHICGQPINYFLQPSSCDDAWEPDHVIPVAMAPDLELDLNNIKASHRRCNRARGDGTNGENVLGMQSRVW